MKYIYDLHNTMLSRNLILVYEGEFTQEITKAVLAMAERNMDSMGEESSIKRKVFNVMVESLQNIVKHSEDFNPLSTKRNAAIFIIGKEDDKYIITSGNPVDDASAASLKTRLDEVNSLDKDGLKKMYKDIIKTNHLSDKGGAGLGFVDMARKSGQKLEYDFKDMDNGFKFFAITTTILRF